MSYPVLGNYKLTLFEKAIHFDNVCQEASQFQFGIYRANFPAVTCLCNNAIRACYTVTRCFKILENKLTRLNAEQEGVIHSE